MSLRSLAGRPARAMLAGGDAFCPKRQVWWNFVSSSPERIVVARRAWTAGEFPRVPGIAASLASHRHLAFNETGSFRHYPELDGD